MVAGGVRALLSLRGSALAFTRQPARTHAVRLLATRARGAAQPFPDDAGAASVLGERRRRPPPRKDGEHEEQEAPARAPRFRRRTFVDTLAQHFEKSLQEPRPLRFVPKSPVRSAHAHDGVSWTLAIDWPAESERAELTVHNCGDAALEAALVLALAQHQCHAAHVSVHFSAPRVDTAALAAAVRAISVTPNCGELSGHDVLSAPGIVVDTPSELGPEARERVLATFGEFLTRVNQANAASGDALGKAVVPEVQALGAALDTLLPEPGHSVMSGSYQARAMEMEVLVRGLVRALGFHWLRPVPGGVGLDDAPHQIAAIALRVVGSRFTPKEHVAAAMAVHQRATTLATLLRWVQPTPRGAGKDDE